MLPDHKNHVGTTLLGQGRVVAMAGDGVNDAPPWPPPTSAMGSGTDVAIESAGVTLLGGDLTGIVKARALSVATMRNIRQNLWFAFASNVAGIPIAAGILYPAFGMLLPGDRRRRDVAVLGQRHRQRPTAAQPAPFGRAITDSDPEGPSRSHIGGGCTPLKLRHDLPVTGPAGLLDSQVEGPQAAYDQAMLPSARTLKPQAGPGSEEADQVRADPAGCSFASAGTAVPRSSGQVRCRPLKTKQHRPTQLTRST